MVFDIFPNSFQTFPRVTKHSEIHTQQLPDKQIVFHKTGTEVFPLYIDKDHSFEVPSAITTIDQLQHF